MKCEVVNMKVRNFKNGFCLVVAKYWYNYKNNAYVTRFYESLEEAEREIVSFERCDGIEYVIVEV